MDKPSLIFDFDGVLYNRPENISETLNYLSQKYQFFIASQSNPELIKQHLDSLGALDYFTDILGADLASTKKEKIFQIITQHQLDLSKVTFITDSPSEIRDGLSLKLGQVIGIAGPYFSELEIKEVQPHQIINNFNQLKDLCV